MRIQELKARTLVLIAKQKDDLDTVKKILEKEIYSNPDAIRSVLAWAKMDPIGSLIANSSRVAQKVKLKAESKTKKSRGSPELENAFKTLLPNKPRRRKFWRRRHGKS